MTTHGGFVLWLTGCPAAGKTTLARALAPLLSAERSVEILDGEEMRRHLSKGLGFSRADRDTHVERLGWVALLLARNGVAVIAAIVSPYAAARDAVRARCAEDGTPFLEVLVDAPLAVRIARDPKGLYRRALAGELPGFTGVSDPYEPPAAPDETVRTDLESAGESTARLLALLRERELIGGRSASSISRRRPRDLDLDLDLDPDPDSDPDSDLDRDLVPDLVPDLVRDLVPDLVPDLVLDLDLDPDLDLDLDLDPSRGRVSTSRPSPSPGGRGSPPSDP